MVRWKLEMCPSARYAVIEDIHELTGMEEIQELEQRFLVREQPSA